MLVLCFTRVPLNSASLRETESLVHAFLRLIPQGGLSPCQSAPFSPFLPSYSALLLSGSVVHAGKTTLKGDTFSFDFPDFNGNQVKSTDDRFKNKVVLVDIWGTWCPNCRLAVPHLNALYNKYKDQGLEVVGLNFEHEADAAVRRERASKAVERLGIEYPILDAGHNDDHMKVLPDLVELEDIPTVLLIGRDGKVRYVKSGFKEGEEKEYEEAIQAALAWKPDA